MKKVENKREELLMIRKINSQIAKNVAEQCAKLEAEGYAVVKVEGPVYIYLKK